MEDKNLYPNFKINGRIFPTWIMHNFKKYKLPEIIRIEGEDPCKKTDAITGSTKLALKKYQEFVSAYMSYKSPYHDILLYHGLGSGKSATAINIYNMLYNSNQGWNVFMLIKASLKENWLQELKKWLSPNDVEHRLSNIVWINYDSPYADTAFLEAIRKTDSSKKKIFMIDEVHIFISNVYNNLSSKTGKRAVTIYDYILSDKKENASTRVVLLSGTPAINKPFEIGLLFNLLRPNVFPKSEALFNIYFLESSNGIQTLNPKTKNMFQRRIMGLVSYYVGGTQDLYASQTEHSVDCVMSEYQTEIYKHYEAIEKAMEKKAATNSSRSTTYKAYTRQASNFVFPPIDNVVSGETRPRPSKFKMSERDLSILHKSSDAKQIKKALSSQSQLYFDMLDKFQNVFDGYLEKIMIEESNSKHTLENDVENFSKYETWKEYIDSNVTKSKTLEMMIKCSTKYPNIIFNILKSSGPVLYYSNYVLMEGIDIFKIYLKYFGFKSRTDPNVKPFFSYGEFHNEISAENRKESIRLEKLPENKDGSILKILIFSPAGAEGINLANMRQVHIMEPYWHEPRIIQMIGRAVRLCSHVDLPMKDRHVDVYRYKSTKYPVYTKEIIIEKTVKYEKHYEENPDMLKTVDFEIEFLAKSKSNLIASFFNAVKEVAIDCELNKNHNMIDSKYKCFQFNEVSLFDKNIGPVYREDMIEDMKIENGSNSNNSNTIKVKVTKIRGIINENTSNYWYNPINNTVYDFEMYYPVGKITKTADNIINKIDKDTYVIEPLNIKSI